MIRALPQIAFIIFAVWAAFAFESVQVSWEPNDPVPEGYRVYQRPAGESYDYSVSAWEGPGSPAVIDAPPIGATDCYVVRAFDGKKESPDSDEVCCSNIVEDDEESDENEDWPSVVNDDDTVPEDSNKDPESVTGGGGCFVRTFINL